MSFASDLKVLWHLTLKPIRGESHAQRLESFYSGQAEAYDDFRRRLLQGRAELYQKLAPPEGAVWIDMGGGTGSNLEYFADDIPQLASVRVVDLSPSLLKVAQQRIAERGWENVHADEADATTYTPPEGQADVVTFSYSLTMIPDWFAALENAHRLLKPGGVIGVVDFYVSRKFPAEGLRRHGWFNRTFWPAWFASDNVFPSPDHLPWLRTHFDTVFCEERAAKVPYIPIVRAPHYLYIGRKNTVSGAY